MMYIWWKKWSWIKTKRIRGREWVSLFMPLFHNFQGDAGTPHQRPACIWSHMTHIWILKSSTHRAISINAIEATHIWIIKQLSRRSQCQNTKEKMLSEFFIFGLVLTAAITGNLMTLCLFLATKCSTDPHSSWNMIVFSSFCCLQEVSARRLKSSLKRALRHFCPANWTLHPQSPPPSSGPNTTKGMKKLAF